ncbi:MAG: hypothetical protein H6737_06430 [Alphaproteobacteria bacterium]|nr:hypothetical protein [Alphaproteobacteria bacterium]
MERWIPGLVLATGCVGAEVDGLEDRLAALETELADARATMEDLDADRSSLAARVTMLEGALAAQAAHVGALEQIVADLDVATLAATLDSQESRIQALEAGSFATEAWVMSQQFAVAADLGQLPALAAYLTVDAATNDVVLTGANLHLRSGSGTTDDASGLLGLGNLIIGYDEDDGTDDKSGSHNLVVGKSHSYTSTATIVAGEDNGTTRHASAVLGGTENTTTAQHAVVVGGIGSEAAGWHSVVAGGGYHVVAGSYAAVSGGYGNTAAGSYGAVLGGYGNGAVEVYSAVVGGEANSAAGNYAVVVGGDQQSATLDHEVVP